MEILAEGHGELLGWHDPDENRAWVREHKPRGLIDKRMSVARGGGAVRARRRLHGMGGFGHVRVPMAASTRSSARDERDLAVAGKTAVHDIDLLIGARLRQPGRVRLLPSATSCAASRPAGRRAVESGQVQVVAELSNAGYQWRFLAGAMGVPFIAARNLVGTDTFEKSSAKVVPDPWSGKPICLLPACYPDVALVPRAALRQLRQRPDRRHPGRGLRAGARRPPRDHHHRGDRRRGGDPRRASRTVIPFYLVDAVVEVPFGRHPCQMPCHYFFDEEHIREWLDVLEDRRGRRGVLGQVRVRRAGLRRVPGADRRARELHHLDRSKRCATDVSPQGTRLQRAQGISVRELVLVTWASGVTRLIG